MGTEQGYPMSGKIEEVPGVKLNPDLVWLRRDSRNQWGKVVVDVKVTSTDDMNKAFKEKDDKYREWATKETQEKKVEKAVMVPLIISHDGAVHRDCEALEGLLTPRQSRLGANDHEGPEVQRCDRWRVIQ